MDDCHREFTESQEFHRLYAFLLFTTGLWISGKLFARAGMPALIGEIAVGILAGPHVQNVVPEADALILEGELALVPRPEAPVAKLYMRKRG